MKKKKKDFSERELHDLSVGLDFHEDQLKGIKRWFYLPYNKFALYYYTGKPYRTLDLGCGEGIIFRDENHKPIQCDISMGRLERAKQRASILIQADGYDLPFKDNSFSDVFLVAILEHTRRPDLIMDEVKRVLRDGGGVVIVVPNDFWMTIGRFILGQRPFRVFDHLTFFSPKKVEKVTKSDSFIKLSSKSLPFPFLPFWFNMCYACFYRKKWHE